LITWKEIGRYGGEGLLSFRSLWGRTCVLDRGNEPAKKKGPRGHAPSAIQCRKSYIQVVEKDIYAAMAQKGGLTRR